MTLALAVVLLAGSFAARASDGTDEFRIAARGMTYRSAVHDGAEVFEFAEYHDPKPAVGKGSRDPSEFRRQDEPAPETPPTEPERRATIQTVTDNLEMVIRGTLEDAAIWAEGLSGAAAKDRLAMLKLARVVPGSVREETAGSGFFGARALFHIGGGALLEAKVIADFGDPHWHLVSINFPRRPQPAAAVEPPAKPSPVPKASAPTMTPEENFRKAVYDYVAERSSGGGFVINDSERGAQWTTLLRLIHSDAMRDLGGGRASAAVEFVDRLQRHDFVLEFIVRRKDATAKVERTTLVSIDGRTSAR